VTWRKVWFYLLNYRRGDVEDVLEEALVGADETTTASSGTRCMKGERTLPNIVRPSVTYYGN
jgi:hypothetical protein